MSRRRFLEAAGLAAAGTVTRAWPAMASSAAPRRLPAPGASGIDHIVVLCMENRSFDHYLGWVPKAEGVQAGLQYPDDHGVLHATHRLDDWQGCGFNDPDHSYAGGRVQYDSGRLDGFRRGGNDDFALGYYTRDQVPVNAALVDGFTICDHWFAGILGPTYPNRFYTHAAATDRISNTMDVSSLPTIWDRLASAGVPASYYFSDVPFLALWGSKYLSIARPVETFFAQAARGTLPAYSYVDPSFIGEDQGGSNDDHPHADIRRGQALIARVVRAVTQSPAWSKTVLVISYDEWGGFFDHVRPPQLPDAFTPTPTEEHNTAGFRVPAYVVSPFARRNHVTHGQYDHSAILKLVEWRWGLAPLTPRDKAARNLASILDFRGPNLRPPAIPDAADPGPHLCTAGPPGTAEPTGMGVAADDAVWHELAGAATHTGWSSVG